MQCTSGTLLAFAALSFFVGTYGEACSARRYIAQRDAGINLVESGPGSRGRDSVNFPQQDLSAVASGHHVAQFQDNSNNFPAWEPLLDPFPISFRLGVQTREAVLTLEARDVLELLPLSVSSSVGSPAGSWGQRDYDTSSSSATGVHIACASWHLKALLLVLQQAAVEWRAAVAVSTNSLRKFWEHAVSEWLVPAVSMLDPENAPLVSISNLSIRSTKASGSAPHRERCRAARMPETSSARTASSMPFMMRPNALRCLRAKRANRNRRIIGWLCRTRINEGMLRGRLSFRLADTLLPLKLTGSSSCSTHACVRYYEHLPALPNCLPVYVSRARASSRWTVQGRQSDRSESHMRLRDFDFFLLNASGMYLLIKHNASAATLSDSTSPWRLLRPDKTVGFRGDPEQCGRGWETAAVDSVLLLVAHPRWIAMLEESHKTRPSGIPEAFVAAINDAEARGAPVPIHPQDLPASSIISLSVFLPGRRSDEDGPPPAQTWSCQSFVLSVRAAMAADGLEQNNELLTLHAPLVIRNMSPLDMICGFQCRQVEPSSKEAEHTFLDLMEFPSNQAPDELPDQMRAGCCGYTKRTAAIERAERYFLRFGESTWFSDVADLELQKPRVPKTMNCEADEDLFCCPAHNTLHGVPAPVLSTGLEQRLRLRDCAMPHYPRAGCNSGRIYEGLLERSSWSLTVHADRQQCLRLLASTMPSPRCFLCPNSDGTKRSPTPALCSRCNKQMRRANVIRRRCASTTATHVLGRRGVYCAALILQPGVYSGLRMGAPSIIQPALFVVACINTSSWVIPPEEPYFAREGRAPKGGVKSTSAASVKSGASSPGQDAAGEVAVQTWTLKAPLRICNHLPISICVRVLDLPLWEDMQSNCLMTTETSGSTSQPASGEAVTGAAGGSAKPDASRRSTRYVPAGGWGLIVIPSECERLCCSVHGCDGLMGSLALGRGPWSPWHALWTGCQNRECLDRDSTRGEGGKLENDEGLMTCVCGPGRNTEYEEEPFRRGLLEEEVIIQTEDLAGRVSQVRACCIFSPVDPSLPPFVRACAAALTIVFSSPAAFLQRCGDIPVSVAPRLGEKSFQRLRYRRTLYSGSRWSEPLVSSSSKVSGSELVSDSADSRPFATGSDDCRVWSSPVDDAAIGEQGTHEARSLRGRDSDPLSKPQACPRLNEATAACLKRDIRHAADAAEALFWACRALEQAGPNRRRLSHRPQLAVSNGVLLGLAELSPMRRAIALSEAFSLNHDQALHLLAAIRGFEAAPGGDDSSSRSTSDAAQGDHATAGSEAVAASSMLTSCGLQNLAKDYYSPRSVLHSFGDSFREWVDSCVPEAQCSRLAGRNQLDRLVPEWYLELDLERLLCPAVRHLLPQCVLKAASESARTARYLPSDLQLTGMKGPLNLRIGRKDLVFHQQNIRKPDCHFLLLTLLPFLPVPATARLSGFLPEGRPASASVKPGKPRSSRIRELRQHPEAGRGCSNAAVSELMTFPELFEASESWHRSGNGEPPSQGNLFCARAGINGIPVRVLSAPPPVAEWGQLYSMLSAPSVTLQLLPRFVFVNTSKLDLEIRQASTGSRCEPVCIMAYNLALASQGGGKSGVSRRPSAPYNLMDECREESATALEGHILNGATPIIRLPHKAAVVFHFTDVEAAYAINIRIASRPPPSELTSERIVAEGQCDIFEPLGLPHPSFEGLRLYDVLLHHGVLRSDSARGSFDISGGGEGELFGKTAGGVPGGIRHAEFGISGHQRPHGSNVRSATEAGEVLTLDTSTRLPPVQEGRGATPSPEKQNWGGLPSAAASMKFGSTSFKDRRALETANQEVGDQVVLGGASAFSTAGRSNRRGRRSSQGSLIGAEQLSRNRCNEQPEDFESQYSGRYQGEDSTTAQLPSRRLEPDARFGNAHVERLLDSSKILGYRRHTALPSPISTNAGLTELQGRFSFAAGRYPGAPAGLPVETVPGHEPGHRVSSLPHGFNRQREQSAPVLQPHLLGSSGHRGHRYDLPVPGQTSNSPEQPPEPPAWLNDHRKPDPIGGDPLLSRAHTADWRGRLTDMRGLADPRGDAQYSAEPPEDWRETRNSSQLQNTSSLPDDQHGDLTETESLPPDHRALTSSLFPDAQGPKPFEDVPLPYFLWTDALYVGAPPPPSGIVKEIPRNANSAVGASMSNDAPGNSTAEGMAQSTPDVFGDAADAAAARSASQSIPLYDCIGYLFASIVSTTTTGGTMDDKGVLYMHFSPAQLAPIHIENHLTDTPILVTSSAPPCFSTVDSMSAATASTDLAVPTLLEGFVACRATGTNSAGPPPIVVPPLQARPVWMRRALPLCAACEAGDIAATKALAAQDAAVADELDLMEREGSLTLERYRKSMIRRRMGWQGDWWITDPPIRDGSSASLGAAEQLRRESIRYGALRGSWASRKLAEGLRAGSRSFELGSRLPRDQHSEEFDGSNVSDFLWPPAALRKILSTIEGVTVKQACAVWQAAQAAAAAARLRWPQSFEAQGSLQGSWGLQGVRQWYKSMHFARIKGRPPAHCSDCSRRWASYTASAKTAALQRSGPAAMAASATATVGEGKVEVDSLQEKLYVRLLGEDLAWIEINLESSKCLKVVLQRPRRWYYFTVRTRGSSIIVSVTPMPPRRYQVTDLINAVGGNGLRENFKDMKDEKRDQRDSGPDELQSAQNDRADNVEGEQRRRGGLSPASRKISTRILQSDVYDKTLRGKLQGPVSFQCVTQGTGSSANRIQPPGLNRQCACSRLFVFFVASIRLPYLCLTYIGGQSSPQRTQRQQQLGIFKPVRCSQGRPCHQIVFDAKMLEASLLGLVSLVDGTLEGGASPSSVRFGFEAGLEEAHVFDFGTDALYPMILGPGTADPTLDVNQFTNLELTKSDTSAVLAFMRQDLTGIQSPRLPKQPMIQLLLIGTVQVMRGYPGMLPFMVYVHQEIEHASIAVSPVVINIHLRSLLGSASSVEAACRLPPDSVIQALSTLTHYTNAHERSRSSVRTNSASQRSRPLGLHRRLSANGIVLSQYTCLGSTVWQCSTCGNPCHSQQALCETQADRCATDASLAVFHCDSPRSRQSPGSVYLVDQTNVRAFCISQVSCSGIAVSIKLRCDDLWTAFPEDSLAGAQYFSNGMLAGELIQDTSAAVAPRGRGARGRHLESMGSCLKSAVRPALLRACNIAHCAVRLRPFRSQVLQMPLPVLTFLLRRHVQHETMRCAASLLAATEALCNVGGWEQRGRLIASLWEDMAETLRHEFLQVFPRERPSHDPPRPRPPVASVSSAGKRVLATTVAGEAEGASTCS